MITPDLHALAEEAGDDWFQHSYQDKDYRSTVVQCVARALAKLQQQHEAELRDWYNCEICGRSMLNPEPNRQFEVPVCIPCWNKAHLKREAERAAAVAETLEKRDQDWILAMAMALGTDSGFEIPIVPKAEPFKELFVAVSSKPSSDMVCVPMYPSEEMQRAGEQAANNTFARGFIVHIYKAMLAAAQEKP